MSWGTRQKRLRDILGSSNSLCFQVCVAFKQTITSDEMFDKYAKAYNINFTETDHISLPKKNYREELFPPTWFYQNSDKKMAHIVTTEALFTLSPYSYTGRDPDLSSPVNDLRKIVSAYSPVIEGTFKEFKFGSDFYADGDGRSVDFRYVVQPYTHEMCNSRDLGLLKPFTLIDGHIIYPNSVSLNGHRYEGPEPKIF